MSELPFRQFLLHLAFVLGNTPQQLCSCYFQFHSVDLCLIEVLESMQCLLLPSLSDVQGLKTVFCRHPSGTDLDWTLENWLRRINFQLALDCSSIPFLPGKCPCLSDFVLLFFFFVLVLISEPFSLTWEKSNVHLISVWRLPVFVCSSLELELKMYLSVSVTLLSSKRKPGLFVIDSSEWNSMLSLDELPLFPEGRSGLFYGV